MPQGGERFFSAAVEEMRSAAVLGVREEGRHEVRARDALGLLIATRAHDADDRHAVGEGEDSAALYCSVGGIVVGCDGGMRVDKADIFATPGVQVGEDCF